MSFFKCLTMGSGFVLFVMAGTYTFANAQDDYEIDDIHDQSKVIVISAQNDGTYNQARTIHDIDDVDWVKFYAVGGESYAIKVSKKVDQSQFNFNPYIELFDRDGQTKIDEQDQAGVPDAEETLDWSCPTGGDGIYYAKVSHRYPLAPPTYLTGTHDYDLVMYQPFLLELPVYLNGTVRNNFNQVISGASIVLSGTQGNGSAISFGNGLFVASALSGPYSVSVSAPGHSNWGGGTSVPGNLNVVLNRLNNSTPIAVPDMFSVERGGSVTGNVLLNDRDGDGDPLTAMLDSNASSGILQFNSNGSFTYTHDGKGGEDSFTYHATDTVANSSTVKVTITFQKKNLIFLMLLLKRNP